jgi:hypothetical protein
MCYLQSFHELLLGVKNEESSFGEVWNCPQPVTMQASDLISHAILTMHRSSTR